MFRNLKFSIMLLENPPWFPNNSEDNQSIFEKAGASSSKISTQLVNVEEETHQNSEDQVEDVENVSKW